MNKAFKTLKALESLDKLRYRIETLELQMGEYLPIRGELAELELRIIEIYKHKDNNS